MLLGMNHTILSQYILQHFRDTASNSYIVSTLIFALKAVVANHLVVCATLPPATEK